MKGVTGILVLLLALVAGTSCLYTVDETTR